MTPEADVLEGSDGYLFLVGGRHHTLSLFTGEKGISRASVQAFHDNIAAREAFCRARGITYSACIFPDKIPALRELLPQAPRISSLYLREYADKAPSADVRQACYPISVLEGRTDRFTRTDTHYSIPGDIAVARHLLERDRPQTLDGLDRALAPFLSERNDFTGDLGRKLSPQRTETTVTLDVARLPAVEIAGNGVETGNDGLLILHKAPAALTSETLLIFGDSFFRHLMPMLTLVFGKVVFCRTRFFHSEIVDAIAPDVIWTGQAERYLSRCAPDADRPHFLSYPLVRGKTLSPDPGLAALWDEMIDQRKLL
jgi:hypothetical protein